MNSSYTSFHKRLWTLDEEALSFQTAGPTEIEDPLFLSDQLADFDCFRDFTDGMCVL